MTADRPLIINRLYGPVPQGEGPTAGRPRLFLRTSRCDLKCSWCDVPETWDWSRYKPAEHQSHETVPWLAQEINDRTEMGYAAGLVITGGEPMLQQVALTELVQRLSPGITIEVETNGRHAPGSVMWDRVDQWNVSPKLANSGNPDELRKPHPFWALHGGDPSIVGKFVVCDQTDLDEVEAIRTSMGLLNKQVWIMPEATDPGLLGSRWRYLEEEVMRRGYSMTGRHQIVAWGKEPGH